MKLSVWLASAVLAHVYFAVSVQLVWNRSIKLHANVKVLEMGGN